MFILYKNMCSAILNLKTLEYRNRSLENLSTMQYMHKGCSYLVSWCWKLIAYKLKMRIHFTSFVLHMMNIKKGVSKTIMEFAVGTSHYPEFSTLFFCTNSSLIIKTILDRSLKLRRSDIFITCGEPRIF